MPQRISVITIAAGVFLLIAPLSLATQWEVSAQLKLIRIGICFLGAAIAVFSGALARLGAASKAMLTFGGVYALAAAWSNYPLQGVVYKMLFFSSLCFGITFLVALTTKESMNVNLRTLALVATVAAFVTWYQYLTNPGQSSQTGRLAIYGINANAIGMTAAGYLFLTLYCALNDKGAARWISTAGTGILVILLIATGSRAAIALAVFGAAVQSVPWLKRPVRLIVPVSLVTVILLALSANLPVEAVERITDFEKNTRAGMWQAGIRLFLQEPVIGYGWLSGAGRSTGNLQNVYFQIFAETGIVGGTVFIVAVAAVFSTAVRTRLRLSRDGKYRYWLAVAILGGLAVHGIAESAVILGTTVNTFLFGFGLGLLENTGRLSRHSAGGPLHRPRAVAEAVPAQV